MNHFQSQGTYQNTLNKSLFSNFKQDLLLKMCNLFNIERHTQQTNMSCLFADCISHGVYHNITNKQKNLTPSANNEMWDKFRTIDLRAL